MKAFFIVQFVGFGVAVIFSWVYEITPEGLKLETNVEPDKSITHQTGRRIDYLIVVAVVGAVALLLLERFVI